VLRHLAQHSDLDKKELFGRKKVSSEEILLCCIFLRIEYNLEIIDLYFMLIQENV